MQQPNEGTERNQNVEKTSSRREFLDQGARSALSSAALTTAAASAAGLAGLTSRSASAAPGGKRQLLAAGCLDYGRSFLCNPKSSNAVRFWIESRTVLFDDKGNELTVFYQCGSCKSEHTFAEKNLFVEDNYDFMPIYGGGKELLILRRHARMTDRYRDLRKAEDVWGKPTFKLQLGQPVRILDTWDAIRDATAAGIPLVTQTEISHPETGLRAVIECPTKTMNVSLDKKMYQVDTGPIAFPDLSRRYTPAVDCIRLAFVAFNAPDFADFVIEQPTPVVEDGVEKCRIYHYSNPISLEAKNLVLAVGEAPK